MISTEFSIFLAFVLIGLAISFLFDFFRILRRVYKTPDFVTIIEDIAFWIISGIILLSGIFILNEGKIRAFLFIGLFAGIVLYIITISKIVMTMGTTILKTINKIILKPIFNFLQTISKVLLKSIKSIKIIINSTNFKIKKVKK